MIPQLKERKDMSEGSSPWNQIVPIVVKEAASSFFSSGACIKQEMFLNGHRRKDIGVGTLSGGVDDKRYSQQEKLILGAFSWLLDDIVVFGTARTVLLE